MDRSSHLSDADTIGLVLAISSSAFIGLSFVLTKIGLRRASAKGKSASKGGYGYLKEPMWWLGLISMMIGESANFTAYGFAPPILVTPMGAFTVIVSAALSVCLLGESLSTRGWLGCSLSIIGAVAVVLHAPRDPEIHSMDEMLVAVEQPCFVAYATATFSLAFILATCVAPTYVDDGGDRQFGELVVLVLICSLVGSMSVLSCKALSISIRLFFLGSSEQILSSASLGAAALAAVCIILQLNYLNRALGAFGISRVAPVYYVFFTTLTLVAAFILYSEWKHTSISAGVFIMMGVVAIAYGVKLLHDDPSENRRSGERELSSDRLQAEAPTLEVHRAPRPVDPLKATLLKEAPGL